MKNNNEKKYRDYIKSPQHWKDAIIKFNGFYSEDKVSIKKIKINRKLFAFDNAVNIENVNYMLMNFSKDLWSPINVNTDYYLLDGQHRLALAKKLGLNYIDVIIENKSKIEYSKEPVKFKKMTMKELINL
ncbi:ParB N-terminal domain-containing protein [Patescibacteria group bacterium]|nr:ParB N-terminal domain-containing protein [Patescibacteria group bacterium]MBU4482010.1 ParB N-terminal domain-containing protein [Patescibacteria group bacterium]